LIDFNFDPAKRRLEACYRGFWSAETANAALLQMKVALDGASVGGQSFTLLDDFRDWSTQNPEVVAINMQFATLCRRYPIKRNAMIIPSALLRLQINRTVQDLGFCRAFSTFDEADSWLGEIEPCS
jgi:hypothetical protein|tara:strand:+ start:8217 stop:8594 length:378 start_codon:yes stop_codon:yes gene_type:complete